MWSVLDTIFKQKFSVDLFEFSDTKYIDSKSSLIEYMQYYLAKMEFCFLWIKRLLFGFRNNQCSISVLKLSKTHTMVVHFLGHGRPKRKNTENATILDSPRLYFLMFHVVFHQHKNCSHHRLLHRTNTYTLPERSLASLRYHFF